MMKIFYKSPTNVYGENVYVFVYLFRTKRMLIQIILGYVSDLITVLRLPGSTCLDQRILVHVKIYICKLLLLSGSK